MILIVRSKGGCSSRREKEGLGIKDSADNLTSSAMCISKDVTLVPGDNKGLIRSWGPKQGIFLLGSQTRNLESHSVVQAVRDDCSFTMGIGQAFLDSRTCWYNGKVKGLRSIGR